MSFYGNFTWEFMETQKGLMDTNRWTAVCWAWKWWAIGWGLEGRPEFIGRFGLYEMHDPRCVDWCHVTYCSFPSLLISNPFCLRNNWHSKLHTCIQIACNCLSALYHCAIWLPFCVQCGCPVLNYVRGFYAILLFECLPGMHAKCLHNDDELCCWSHICFCCSSNMPRPPKFWIVCAFPLCCSEDQHILTSRDLLVWYSGEN